MQFARLFGILVVFGAPAIIGGGLVFHLLHSWLAVWAYEIALAVFAFKTAVNAASKTPAGEPAHNEH